MACDMHFSYSMWRPFAATASVAALFVGSRPHEIIPVTATLVGAIGLAGLILLAHRGNFGLISQGTAWARCRRLLRHASETESSV